MGVFGFGCSRVFELEWGCDLVKLKLMSILSLNYWFYRWVCSILVEIIRILWMHEHALWTTLNYLKGFSIVYLMMMEFKDNDNIKFKLRFSLWVFFLSIHFVVYVKLFVFWVPTCMCCVRSLGTGDKHEVMEPSSVYGRRSTAAKRKSKGKEVSMPVAGSLAATIKTAGARYELWKFFSLFIFPFSIWI